MAFDPNVITLDFDKRFNAPNPQDFARYLEWLPTQTRLIWLFQLLKEKDVTIKYKDDRYKDVYELLNDQKPVKMPVYVFGSNLAGRHGAGAAKVASTLYGAKNGVGSGPQGNAYGIPTKDEQLQPLTLDQVTDNIGKFMAYAQNTPTREFEVARVGCGLAGFRDADISAIFREQIEMYGLENVHLPMTWRPKAQQHETWVFAGSRDFDEAKGRDAITNQLNEYVSRDATVVVGACRGPDRWAEEIAWDNEYNVVRYPAFWENLGKVAGYARNGDMGCAGNNLFALHAGESSGTENMIDTMRKQEYTDLMVIVD